MLAKLDNMLRLVDDQQTGQQARKQSKPAEDNFQLDNPGNQENFGRNHPEQRNVVAAEFERHGSKHQHGAHDGEENECGTAAACRGQLTAEEFSRADCK